VAGKDEGASVRNDDSKVEDDSNVYGKRSFPESPVGGLQNEIIEPQKEAKTALAKDVP